MVKYDRILSLLQASKRLYMTEAQALKLAEEGKIGKKIGGRYRFNVTEVASFRRVLREAGELKEPKPKPPAPRTTVRKHRPGGPGRPPKPRPGEGSTDSASAKE